MKRIIGVVLVGVCVLLVGCGQSAQEEAALTAQKASKVEPYKPAPLKLQYEKNPRTHEK